MRHHAGEFPHVPFIPSEEEQTVKTASDVQDTAKNNPDRLGSKAPNGTQQGMSWQFYFIMVVIGLGLLMLLGRLFGLF
jgi:hypothetical protein